MRCVAGVLLAVWCDVCPGAEGDPPVVQELVITALKNNPKVLEAKAIVSRYRAYWEETDGFFDAVLSAGANQTDDTLGLDQTQASVGAERAFMPGFRLKASVAETYYDNIQSTMESTLTEQTTLYQNAATLSLAVPLMKNRGFKQWSLSKDEARLKYQAMRNQYLAIEQDYRHQVEQRIIAMLEATTLAQVNGMAVQRVERLLKESLELVALKTIPEYQVFSARMEVGLQSEQHTASQQIRETALIRLVEIVGDETICRRQDFPTDLVVKWAEASSLPITYTDSIALSKKGTILQLQQDIEASDAALKRVKDDAQSDLQLAASATAMGEDPNRLWSSGRYLNDRNLGAVVGLIWSRPWELKTEKARARAATALIVEKREQLRHNELRILADLKVAFQQYRIARERLTLVTGAIESARQALDAEDERFRLGEGRSRNVLDAQKDLTDALKRQIVIAAEVLRAYSDFHFTAGYVYHQDLSLLTQTGEP